MAPSQTENYRIIKYWGTLGSQVPESVPQHPGRTVHPPAVPRLPVHAAGALSAEPHLLSTGLCSEGRKGQISSPLTVLPDSLSLRDHAGLNTVSGQSTVGAQR